DRSGNAYVTGTTGYGATFVTKLNATGTALLYSTFLGGGGSGYGDEGTGIAVDGSGNAYVTGRTDSSYLPTTAGAYQTSLGGYGAFVANFSFSPAVTLTRTTLANWTVNQPGYSQTI